MCVNIIKLNKERHTFQKTKQFTALFKPIKETLGTSNYSDWLVLRNLNITSSILKHKH